MPLEIVHIVEDDPAQAHLLDHSLRKASFRTTVSMDGANAWHAIERLRPNLVLLDVMLPGIDGYTLCRRLRDDTRFQDLPIILVSALGNEEQRIAGFEAGADDYITKPFSPREVISRVQAVLMRQRAALPGGEQYLDGKLTLEGGCLVAHIAAHVVTLSAAEGAILRCLAERVNDIVTHDELAALVWKADGAIRERHLAHLIDGLRRKLDNGGIVIEMVSSAGYRLRCERLST